MSSRDQESGTDSHRTGAQMRDARARRDSEAKGPIAGTDEPEAPVQHTTDLEIDREETCRVGTRETAVAAPERDTNVRDALARDRIDHPTIDVHELPGIDRRGRPRF